MNLDFHWNVTFQNFDSNFNRLMLYGNVQDVMTSGNGRQGTYIYTSNSNNDNGAGFSNKKSDHSSWWNSQSSSSRFSSPSYKSEARGQMRNGGRPTPNTGRGTKMIVIFSILIFFTYIKKFKSVFCLFSDT